MLRLVQVLDPPLYLSIVFFLNEAHTECYGFSENFQISVLSPTSFFQKVCHELLITLKFQNTGPGKLNIQFKFGRSLITENLDLQALSDIV